MSKFTVTHTINCDAETFWKTFFDKDFNEKLYKGFLGFPDFETVEVREEEKTIFRKAKGKPKMEVPGVVAKLIGDNFRYSEEGTLDRASGKFKWKMTPSTMADKLFTSGTVWIEPAGDGKVKRFSEMNVEAKVFGVGGVLESSAEKQLRDGWDKSATFMNKYLAEKK